MDDDDEERSRSIPSRTRIGKQAAILEKFPSLAAPLSLFCGLITIPFWGYRNTSMAMLDVMISDLPHVEYRKEKILESDIEEAKKRTEQIQTRVKSSGLGKKLSNKVNAEAFLAKFRKQE